MTATISKWGNSQGLRFPKDVMRQLHLAVGDKIKIMIEDDRIILEPLRQARSKFNIEDLVRDIPEGNREHEVFDDVVGREAW